MSKLNNQYVNIPYEYNISHQNRDSLMIDAIQWTMQNGKTQEERDHAANVLFMFCVESLNNK